MSVTSVGKQMLLIGYIFPATVAESGVGWTDRANHSVILALAAFSFAQDMGNINKKTSTCGRLLGFYNSVQFDFLSWVTQKTISLSPVWVPASCQSRFC